MKNLLKQHNYQNTEFDQGRILDFYAGGGGEQETLQILLNL